MKRQAMVKVGQHAAQKTQKRSHDVEQMA